jgi:hypothetical protein
VSKHQSRNCSIVCMLVPTNRLSPTHISGRCVDMWYLSPSLSYMYDDVVHARYRRIQLEVRCDHRITWCMSMRLCAQCPKVVHAMAMHGKHRHGIPSVSGEQYRDGIWKSVLLTTALHALPSEFAQSYRILQYHSSRVSDSGSLLRVVSLDKGSHPLVELVNVSLGGRKFYAAREI